MSVDFNDGLGYQTVTTNGISHSYTDSSGYKEIVFRGETSPGQYVYCKSLLAVEVDNATANRYIDTDPYAKVVLIKNLPNAGAYTDFQDRLQIRYSLKNTTRTLAPAQQHLRKTIIYVEGYDVSGSDVKPNIIGPNGPTGLLGYNLLNLIRIDNDNQEKNGEWIKLANPVGPNYDFMHDLDDVAGYDLVFVNYNTLRSIEANALMLQRVIEWVNADKAIVNSVEKNVVIGVSMGGIVARYCLASMTRASFNSTDTKLLITHDSPHQGSNVPLGLQYFLYDLAYTKILGSTIKSKVGELREFIELNENGGSTEQLLRARAVYVPGSMFPPLEASLSTEFNTFFSPGGVYQQMVNLPANLRPYKFVATAQGSQCGVPVSASNTLYAHQNEKFGSISATPATVIALASVNPVAAFLALFGLKYNLETQIKSLPAQGVAQVEYFKMTKKLSFIGIGLATVGIKERSRNNPLGFNDWDNVPGSTQSIANRGGPTLTEGPMQNLNFPLKLIASAKLGLNLKIDNDYFSFVSTTSALDAPPGTNNYAIFNYGINGNANTRTDKYISQEFYASKYNQNHTDYTPRNAQWMYEEMENITHFDGCKSDCPSNAGYAISGVPTLCTFSDYTVTGLNSSLSVGGWAITPQGLATIVVSGNTATLTAIPGVSGNITLSAAVQADGCNAANPIIKQIFVGKPLAVNSIEEFQEINANCSITKKVQLLNTNNETTYTWYSSCISPTPTAYLFRGTGTIRPVSQINPCDDVQGQFKTRVDAGNTCGVTVGTLEKVINFNNQIEYDQQCLNPPLSNTNNYFIEIFPNPVTTQAQIRLKYLPPPNAPFPYPSLNMVKLRLFSSSYQLITNVQLNNVNIYTLYTSTLMSGSYYLQVQSASGEWLQATLIK